MGTSNENRQHSETVTGEIQRAVFDIETIKPQLEKAEESRTIHLSLLESVHIHGVLGGSSRAVPGVLTHRYDINEPEVGTMIVSVAGEEVSARIQLDSSGRLFVIRKDHSSDSYVVIEIDPQQLDILEEGEPLQVPGL